MRNLLKYQAIFIILGVILSLFTSLLPAPVAYGGSIVLLNTLQQIWHVKRAEKLAGSDAAYNLRIIYRCAIERLVLGVAMLAFGMVSLKLDPLSLISGYSFGYLGVIIFGLGRRS